MATKLTEEEYKETMTKDMVDLAETVQSVVDIWDYVGQLTKSMEVLEYVNNERLVEKVYWNDEATFDHVLLPTDKSNIFIVIVIDLNQRIVTGHFRLDLNEQYGLDR